MYCQQHIFTGQPWKEIPTTSVVHEYYFCKPEILYKYIYIDVHRIKTFWWPNLQSPSDAIVLILSAILSVLVFSFTSFLGPIFAIWTLFNASVLWKQPRRIVVLYYKFRPNAFRHYILYIYGSLGRRYVDILRSLIISPKVQISFSVRKLNK